MWYGDLIFPLIAPAGQFFAHLPQPIQNSGLMWNLRSAVQTFARHFLSLICSSYSSRKRFRVLITGSGALLPSPQRAMLCTIVASSSSSSRSDISPLPSTILSRISNIRFVPSRHGTHLPQLSRCVKFIKNLATSTIQVFSSITTRPPEPMIASSDLTESKSSGRSIWSSIRHPPDGPPICTPLKAAPLFRPPPIS